MISRAPRLKIIIPIIIIDAINDEYFIFQFDIIQSPRTISKIEKIIKKVSKDIMLSIKSGINPIQFCGLTKEDIAL
jgi:hypothetical protein